MITSTHPSTYFAYSLSICISVNNNKLWLYLGLVWYQVTHVSNPKIGTLTSPITYYIPTTFTCYYKLMVSCSISGTTSLVYNMMVLLFMQWCYHRPFIDFCIRRKSIEKSIAFISIKSIFSLKFSFKYLLFLLIASVHHIVLLVDYMLICFVYKTLLKFILSLILFY